MSTAGRCSSMALTRPTVCYGQQKRQTPVSQGPVTVSASINTYTIQSNTVVQSMFVTLGLHWKNHYDCHLFRTIQFCVWELQLVLSLKPKWILQDAEKLYMVSLSKIRCSRGFARTITWSTIHTHVKNQFAHQSSLFPLQFGVFHFGVHSPRLLPNKFQILLLGQRNTVHNGCRPSSISFFITFPQCDCRILSAS